MVVTIDIALQHEGQLINNPLLDSTGRFAVLPSKEYKLDEEITDMEEIILNGTPILLNWDGYNNVLALLDELSPLHGRLTQEELECAVLKLDPTNMAHIPDAFYCGVIQGKIQLIIELGYEMSTEEILEMNDLYDICNRAETID